MIRRSYSPEFKSQVVLEALSSSLANAEITRAYEIHLVTLLNWKSRLKQDGAKALGGDNELKEKESKIDRLERVLDKKEVGTALLKFFGEDENLKSP